MLHEQTVHLQRRGEGFVANNRSLSHKYSIIRLLRTSGLLSACKFALFIL